MGEHTGISWTDHTFNPWWGCTKVSPGCDHCYADGFDHRTQGGHVVINLHGDEEVQGIHWGKGAPRREFGEKHWNEPLKWNRDALAKLGRPARVFCASMADVMDDEAPAGARERLWALIDETPNLIWQLLTKRPHRYTKYLPETFRHGNVWLGTTAENQEFYGIRWPILCIEAMNRGLTTWISYEPALGPLELKSLRTMHTLGNILPMFPDWVIFGGESGNGRRECKREWADALLAQCKQTGVEFYMKQMGGRTPEEGKRLIPADLLIQEFPEVTKGAQR